MDITSDAKQEIIDITTQVLDIIKKEGWRNGLCIVFTPSSATALTIRDNEVQKNDEDNIAKFINEGFMGPSQALIINNCDWQRGKYQKIYFCELDGPHKRKLVFQFVGEK